MNHFLYLSVLFHKPSLQPPIPLFSLTQFLLSVISTINMAKVGMEENGVGWNGREWCTNVKRNLTHNLDRKKMK